MFIVARAEPINTATVSVRTTDFGNSPCTLDGKSFKNTESVTFYRFKWAPVGTTCDSINAGPRICSNGFVLGNPLYKWSTCKVLKPYDLIPPSVTFATSTISRNFEVDKDYQIIVKVNDNRWSKGVSFYVNNNLILTDEKYPFSFNFRASTIGTSTVKAVAYDGYKNTSEVEKNIFIDGKSCFFNNKKIMNNSSTTAYISNRPYVCETEQRVCNNGILSGSYTDSKCKVKYYTTDKITVSGKNILNNGKNFISKGLIFEGFLEPKDWLQECVDKQVLRNEFCSRHLDSRNYYFGVGKYSGGNDALTLAKENWHINAVRFNVSQTALNPNSKWYNENYVNELVDIVSKAREKGLVVYIAIFSASNKNAPDMLLERNPYVPLNTEDSKQSAITLSKIFGKDQGVVIELLNEPWSPTNITTGWLLWRDGGTLNNPKSPFNGYKFVGVNNIISSMRVNGSKNLIGLQGLLFTMSGFPGGIKDPLSTVFYSVHPFFAEDVQNDSVWDNNFGKFADKYPFVATAWDGVSSDSWCKVSGPTTPNKLLDYLYKKQIGVFGYAADVPYTVTRNFQTDFDKPTQMSDKCESWGRFGQLLKDHFAK